MIDIHAHILPNIDDGSKNIEESLNMANEAEKAGFTDIITTSHYIINWSYNADKQKREELIKDLQKNIDDMEINLKLHNGAESYVSPELVNYYLNGKIPTLAGSKYALFEFPRNDEVLYGDMVIENLIKQGYIPVIAHPERYLNVQQNIGIAYKWIKKGAILQSNYGSILGNYGEDAKKAFIKLLKNKMITFLGSDCHKPLSVYINVKNSLIEIKKYANKHYIEEITELNQRKVINNEEIKNENI